MRWDPPTLVQIMSKNKMWDWGVDWDERGCSRDTIKNAGTGLENVGQENLNLFSQHTPQFSSDEIEREHSTTHPERQNGTTI